MNENRSVIPVPSGAYISTVGQAEHALANMPSGSSLEDKWDTSYVAASEIQIGVKLGSAFVGIKKSARTVQQTHSTKVTKG